MCLLDAETRVYKKWSGGVRRATTLCIMSAGGDELFWRAVSDTSRQFGGDDLGVAVEERSGQRPGDALEPPMGQQADDSKEWWWAGLPRAAGEMCRGRRRGL